jgi:hypothetical protein
VLVGAVFAVPAEQRVREREEEKRRQGVALPSEKPAEPRR